MRKQLLSGTALAAAGMLAAGGALAADKKMMKPSMSVNGYYEAVVGGILDEEHKTGGVDNVPDTSAVDTRTDAEIHFNGRATTDMGLKFHARVELEGQNNHSHTSCSATTCSSDPIDEYFLSVSGAFGQIVLGGTGGVPVKMLTGLSGSWATGVGENLSFDDGWTPSATPGADFHRLRHSRLDTGDSEKISYISPKFGGVQVGLTYSPQMKNNDDNSRPVIDDEAHDGLEGAVSYSGKFQGVGVAAGVGMTSYQGAQKGGKDLADWLIGGRLDFGGGFRVAFAYKKTTKPDDKPGSKEATLIDLGARYVVGANQFSLTGMAGQMDEGPKAKHNKIMASYARALGAGVKWHANVIWNSSENGMKGADKKENSGTALVSGLKVTF